MIQVDYFHLFGILASPACLYLPDCLNPRPPPTPQNSPYLWKSYACISYYLALTPPCIYANISIIKKIAK